MLASQVFPGRLLNMPLGIEKCQTLLGPVSFVFIARLDTSDSAEFVGKYAFCFVPSLAFCRKNSKFYHSSFHCVEQHEVALRSPGSSGFSDSVGH